MPLLSRSVPARSFCSTVSCGMTLRDSERCIRPIIPTGTREEDVCQNPCDESQFLEVHLVVPTLLSCYGGEQGTLHNCLAIIIVVAAEPPALFQAPESAVRACKTALDTQSMICSRRSQDNCFEHDSSAKPSAGSRDLGLSFNAPCMQQPIMTPSIFLYLLTSIPCACWPSQWELLQLQPCSRQGLLPTPEISEGGAPQFEPGYHLTKPASKLSQAAACRVSSHIHISLRKNI